MFFQLVILLAFSEDTYQNLISTAQGRVRGVGHDGYVSYRGIPYATVAAVDGRFKKAGIAPFWSGIRDSKESHCSSVSMVEECLQLDVHMPASETSSWPVLVWVTGGSGQYNPSLLVKQGIIVVVVHHRIGPLGFLCVGDEKIPGNAAVKDIVLALRWVQDNIVAFKGNSAKVILAGQSIGAAIAEAITLSPMADGLYHGVILESGTVLAPWLFNYDGKERAMLLGDMLTNNDYSSSVFMDAKVEELVESSNKLEVPYFPFGVCIENPLKHEERLLPEAPVDLLKARKVGRVPMVIGYNSNEAYVFTSILKETKVSKSRMSNLLPQELKFLNDRERNQIARQIEDTYFKRNMSMNTLLKYHRDAYFLNHIHRSVRLHAAAHSVYYYQFSYSSNFGVQEEPGVKKMGAAHSDELGYLFSGRQLKGDDEVVQRNLVKLWTDFVKHLNPTHDDSTSWDTVDPDHPQVLDIGTELKMTEFPHTHTTAMWDDIFDRFYYSRNRVVS